jgi:hypothetical protein
MEAMHLCPHCGGPLDEVGEQTVREAEVRVRRRRREREVAYGRFRKFNENYWYYEWRNPIKYLILLLISLIGVWFGGYFVKPDLPATLFLTSVVLGLCITIAWGSVVKRLDTRMHNRILASFAEAHPKYWMAMTPLVHVSVMVM